MKQHEIVRQLTYGMVGGAIGTIVMEQLATLIYRFEDPKKKKQEEEIRKESPYDTMARRIANDILRVHLSDEDIRLLGQLLHWGYGIGWGAIYGLMRDRIPAVRKAAGLPFGIVFSLIGDEALNTALKLTPPPQAYPIDSHIRGLVAHIVYTATAEGVIRTLERVAA